MPNVKRRLRDEEVAAQMAAYFQAGYGETLRYDLKALSQRLPTDCAQRNDIQRISLR